MTEKEAVQQLSEAFDIFVHELFFGLGSRVAPLYLLSTIIICLVIFAYRRPSVSFFKWLMPAKIYFHKSAFLDVKLFLFGRFVTIFALFGLIALTAIVASFISSVLGGDTTVSANDHPFLIALILLGAKDFAVYWVHRIHHENLILWPFHSVHHSAEVLTPITAYRKHPVYDIISQFFRSVLVGSIQGFMLGIFVGNVDILTIAGVNALYVAFNFVGSNLRHSHIWLSYGSFMEHIFISPAQHQIHHSLDPKHINKNYGEVFAIWDWMFGSLYVPKGREELEFGLSDGDGRLIEQPHPSLTRSLIVPFKDSWRAMRSMLKK